MRRPRPARGCAPLPTLSQLVGSLLVGGAAWVSALDDAQAQPIARDASGRATTSKPLHVDWQVGELEGAPQRVGPVPPHADAGAAGDAAAVGDAMPVSDATAVGDAGPLPVIEPPQVLGGVPMRTGGEPPRHGACACDVPGAAQSPPSAMLAAGAVAAGLLRRRRRASSGR